MKTYAVGLPVTGVAYVTVQEESEDAAIQAAMEIVSIEHLEEWQAHRIICEGNVLHASPNEAWAECEDDEEET